MERLKKFADHLPLSAFGMWLEHSERGRLIQVRNCICSQSKKKVGEFKTAFCIGHVIYEGSYWPTVEVLK